MLSPYDWLHFQQNTHSLLNWFLDIKSSSLEQEGEHRKYALADHITSAYQLLNGGIIANPCTIDLSHHVSLESFNGTKSKLGTRIKELVTFLEDNLSEYVRIGLFHGSLSDNQISLGWSDIDTWIVLKDEVLTNTEKLIEVRDICFEAQSYVERICKYQHHGFLFLAQFELNHYPSSYMPKEALHCAKLFLGECDRFSLKIIRQSQNSRKSMESRLKIGCEALYSGLYKHHPHNSQYLKIDFSNKTDNMYQLFAYLCYIMLIPSLCMDARGTPCYKAESYRKIASLLAPRSLDHIRMLTYIRSEWETRENFGRGDNSIPEWLMKELGPTFMRDGIEVLKDALKVVGK